ncbi:MAG: hypothetical protein V1841_00160 [Patescibacteria group bacterium]
MNHFRRKKEYETPTKLYSWYPICILCGKQNFSEGKQYLYSSPSLHPRFSTKADESFTLIETMLAIFILVVGIFGCSQIFPFGLSIEKSSEMSMIATQFAQAKIEELISKSYDEIICTASLPPCEDIENPLAENNAFQRETNIKFSDPLNNLQEPNPSNTDGGIKKIEVLVSWKSPFSAVEENITIVTIVAIK